MKLFHAIKQYRFQLSLVIALRLGYSIWLALLWSFIDKWFPLTPYTLWENYYHLTRSTTLLGRSFIDAWLRWDAVHYMNIAKFGYQGVGSADTVFFPLYPYIVGVLSKITTINVILVGILVSSFATLFALISLYELVVELFDDPNLARWSVLLLAFYPTAFFLHAPYTDALFLFCSITSILMMVRKEYLFAGLFVCAAGLIRPQGILLMIPMVVFYIQERLKDKKYFVWHEFYPLVIAPLGFSAYSIWRITTGLSGMFHSLQEYSSVRFQDPLTTLIKAFNGIIQNPTFLQVTEFLSVLFFLAILVWMFTRKEFQQHLGIMLYSAATWVLIVSKTTITSSPLQSSNRYVLHIFFAFVGLAMILQKFPEKYRKLVVFSFFMLAMVNITLYALWIFVG